MKQVLREYIGAMIVTMCAGCATAVPGSEKVKITRNPADVSGCTAVGNISAESMNSLDPVIAQNQAVGLGGDVVINTGAGGVAYRCSKTAGQ
jgi:hypothetical protein